MSAPGGFNDLDMLTVGMYGKGNVGLGDPCTFEEYRMQFSLWCLFGVPLMMGCDLRTLSGECKALLQSEALIAIDQDEECRPPYLVRRGGVTLPNPDAKPGEYPWRSVEDCTYTFIRHLAGNEFVLAFFNLSEHETRLSCLLSDIGLPYPSGVGIAPRDVFTGEQLGMKRDEFSAVSYTHLDVYKRQRLFSMGFSTIWIGSLLRSDFFVFAQTLRMCTNS